MGCGAYAYRARTNTSFIMCRVTTIDLVTRFDACMIAFLDTELSTSDDDACIAFLNESNSCLSGRHVKRHCTALLALHDIHHQAASLSHQHDSCQSPHLTLDVRR